MIFKHFIEHKKADHQISFIKFLDMHYMHGSPKDKDYHQDMQLPFKTSGETLLVLANEYIPFNQSISIAAPFILVPTKKISFEQNSLCNSYLASIWQPPKNC